MKNAEEIENMIEEMYLESPKKGYCVKINGNCTAYSLGYQTGFRHALYWVLEKLEK